MAYRDMMKSSVHALFEQGKRILNGIGVVLTDPISMYVIDSAMASFEMVLSDYHIEARFIRLQQCIGSDVLQDYGFNRLFPSVRNRNEAKPPTALDHAENNVSI